MSQQKQPNVSIPVPDFSEVNAALVKISEHMNGLRVYSQAEIKAIKAAAWFEGWHAGDSDAFKQQDSLARSGKPASDDDMSTNPYGITT